jgi:hypothetical protein
MSRKAQWWAAFLLLGLACPFLAGCELSSARYFAYVDRVEPAIPGLDVQGTRGIGGEISIVNDTGMDVYIYDEDGQEVLKITPTASYRKLASGKWGTPRAGNAAPHDSSAMQYLGLPPDSDNQVVKTWEIAGRAGDTPFTIYGRTVYEPAKWGD